MSDGGAGKGAVAGFVAGGLIGGAAVAGSDLIYNKPRSADRFTAGGGLGALLGTVIGAVVGSAVSKKIEEKSGGELQVRFP